jgi:prevent-host-death family protein
VIEANMHEAKTRLSQLVKAAERGEEVFLKRNGVRIAQIIPAPKRKFPFGFLKDKVAPIADDLLFNTSEEIIEEFTRL